MESLGGAERYGVKMVLSFKDLVDGLDKLYDFAGKLKRDISNYLENREKNRLLRSLREYISAYDADVTKIKAKIDYAQEKGDNEWFDRNRENIEKMFHKLSKDYWDTIVENFLSRAGEILADNPELREALIIKFQYEGVDEYDPDPFPIEIRTLPQLSWWINAVKEKTRTALKMLNNYIG